jgi:NAD(P)H-flavin reductase
MPLKVEFLYSTKPALTEKQNINPSAVLFLSRLTRIASERPNQFDLTLFVTNQEYQKIKDPQALGWFHDRRISEVDLLAALGLDVNMRAKTVCYVCGPPKMTDQTVAFLGRQGGMDMERVFCEKWW